MNPVKIVEIKEDIRSRNNARASEIRENFLRRKIFSLTFCFEWAKKKTAHMRETELELIILEAI